MSLILDALRRGRSRTTGPSMPNATQTNAVLHTLVYGQLSTRSLLNSIKRIIAYATVAFDAWCRACDSDTRDLDARAGASAAGGAIGSTGASVCGRSETDGAAGRGSCRARDAPGALESQNAACAGTCVNYAADHSGNAESS